MWKVSKIIQIGGLLLAFVSPVFAISPTEQIQQTLKQVTGIVANTTDSDERRKELLRQTLMPRFDWLEMSKQALGKNWRHAAGRESEFVAAFTSFLGNAYIDQIGSYRAEKVLFVQESIENSRAQVKTRIVSDKGEATSVDYRLRELDGEWKIYDVVIEDISIIANYRSQFRRILANGSFEDLMRQLKEKDLKRKGQS